MIGANSSSVWLGLWLASWGLVCNPANDPPAAPLLKLRNGLQFQVAIAENPLLFSTQRKGQARGDGPATGYVFAGRAGAVITVSLTLASSPGESLLALYGPRSKDGLFGAAWASAVATPEHPAFLWGVQLARSGDYLLAIVRRPGAEPIDFELALDCSSGCARSTCPARTCSAYCRTGFVSDSSGCPSCDCVVGCQADSDCPSGWGCDLGACVRILACGCKDAYQPLCGSNGQTYANLCEWQCLSGPVAQEGTCSSTGIRCKTSGDCSAGFACQAGQCVSSCDCLNEPFDPVCGVGGITFANDCERTCARVDRLHVGSCDECVPTNGGCGGLACTSDSSCPPDQICANGVCQSR